MDNKAIGDGIKFGFFRGQHFAYMDRLLQFFCCGFVVAK